MPLSDTQIKSLKPAADPRKFSDGGGLHVRVMPQGSKLWRLAYVSMENKSCSLWEPIRRFHSPMPVPAVTELIGFSRPRPRPRPRRPWRTVGHAGAAFGL